MDWHIIAFALGFIAMDLLTGFAQAVANKKSARRKCETDFGTSAGSC